MNRENRIAMQNSTSNGNTDVSGQIVNKKYVINDDNETVNKNVNGDENNQNKNNYNNQNNENEKKKKKLNKYEKIVQIDEFKSISDQLLNFFDGNVEEGKTILSPSSSSSSLVSFFSSPPSSPLSPSFASFPSPTSIHPILSSLASVTSSSFYPSSTSPMPMSTHISMPRAITMSLLSSSSYKSKQYKSKHDKTKISNKISNSRLYAYDINNHSNDNDDGNNGQNKNNHDHIDNVVRNNNKIDTISNNKCNNNIILNKNIIILFEKTLIKNQRLKYKRNRSVALQAHVSDNLPFEYIAIYKNSFLKSKQLISKNYENRKNNEEKINNKNEDKDDNKNDNENKNENMKENRIHRDNDWNKDKANLNYDLYSSISMTLRRLGEGLVERDVEVRKSFWFYCYYYRHYHYYYCIFDYLYVYSYLYSYFFVLHSFDNRSI